MGGPAPAKTPPAPTTPRPSLGDLAWVNLLGVYDIYSNVRLAWARRKGPLEPRAIRPGSLDDLSGKVCLVTGGSAGIGKATAAALARRGAHVIVTGRSKARNKAAMQEIRKEVPIEGCSAPRVEAMELDLASFEAVRKFLKDFEGKGLPLDVLVCNAGIMTPPTREVTVDGHEVQWQTNHLSHWLLTTGLLEITGAIGGTPRKGAKGAGSRGGGRTRVVFLSSVSHNPGVIDYNDPNGENKPYRPFEVYGQSKLANVLTAQELQRRHGGRKYIYPVALRSAEASAEGVVWCVTAPDEVVAGQYFYDTVAWKPGKGARDPAAARRLWDFTAKIVGSK